MVKTNLSDDNVIDILGASNLESKETHADDPLAKSRIRVTLDQLRPYDNNPRTTRNPKFNDILASIENAGLEQPPNISRRHPEDPHYMIIDGGNTRLEILNLLYEKYTRLAQQAESDEARLTYSQKAESFYVIDCIFKPWVSESKALTGHMSENENRGDMLFIEKAVAVQRLRQIYEVEDREKAIIEGHEFNFKSLSSRKLAERITAQGWTINHSQIIRYDYAVNTLMEYLQDAFWSGAGAPLVRNLRRYDVAYTRFWQSTEASQTEPDRIGSLFLDTLRLYDGESVDIRGFLQDLNAQLGKLVGLHPSSVMAEIEAIMNGASASPATRKASSPSPEELVRHYKDTAPPNTQPIKTDNPTSSQGSQDNPTNTRQNSSGKMTERDRAQQRPSAGINRKDFCASEGLQDRLLILVHALASRHGLRIVEVTPEQRKMGVTVVFAVAPIDRQLLPGQDEELATVWWALTKYSLSFLGDQANRYISFLQVLKKMFSRYFEQQAGPLGTLLFFEEQILSCRPELRDQLYEIQRLCGLMIQEITDNKTQ